MICLAAVLSKALVTALYVRWPLCPGFFASCVINPGCCRSGIGKLPRRGPNLSAMCLLLC